MGQKLDISAGVITHFSSDGSGPCQRQVVNVEIKIATTGLSRQPFIKTKLHYPAKKGAIPNIGKTRKKRSTS